MTVATPTFDQYYNRAMQQVQPYMNRGIEDTKAGFVDQGLLSSTAGQGKLGDVRSQFLAQTVGMAQNQANTDRTFDENRRQFNAQQAARIYELLMSGYLGRRQLQGNNRGLRVPTDPVSFRSFQRFTGDPIEQREPMMMVAPEDMRGMGYPMGDPREQWARYTEKPVSDLGERNLNAQSADAAAGRAIQRAQLQLDKERLAWQKSIAEQEGSANDPWANIAAYIRNITQNPEMDKDPQAPGIQRSVLPSTALGSIMADPTMGQFDILAIAKDAEHPDNPRAVAIIKTLYPETWREKLGMDTAFAGRTDGGWRRSHQPERTWLDRVWNDKFFTWKDVFGGGNPDATRADFVSKIRTLR